MPVLYRQRSQLGQALPLLADVVSVGMAANTLSKYLNVKSGRLLDEYHVRYENKVRHEGWRITLASVAASE